MHKENREDFRRVDLGDGTYAREGLDSILVERQELQREGGRFKTEMTIPERANRVTISVRSADDPNRFLSLVSYDVIN
jgi:hypothetical protein